MATETYETLNEMTVAALREIIKERKIVGFARKTKDETIKAILAYNDAKGAPAAATVKASGTNFEKAQGTPEVTAAQFNMSSIMTKPGAKKGDKTTTTIQVSCGANTADFPVVDKTVGAVQEFLKEVLNIDSVAQGQVNGKVVGSDYALKTGDTLEFIKPAGRKGTGETAESLEKMTVAQLKDILRARKIVGYFKAAKAGIIAAILAAATPAPASACAAKTAPVKTAAKDNTVKAAQFNMSSIMTKPNAKKGDKTTTTIQVSCGANTADFPVIDKTVGAVQEFLKEVLNIDSVAQGQVNGKVVGSDYALKEGDTLEFIKPAGRKG